MPESEAGEYAVNYSSAEVKSHYIRSAVNRERCVAQGGNIHRLGARAVCTLTLS